MVEAALAEPPMPRDTMLLVAARSDSLPPPLMYSDKRVRASANLRLGANSPCNSAWLSVVSGEPDPAGVSHSGSNGDPALPPLLEVEVPITWTSSRQLLPPWRFFLALGFFPIRPELIEPTPDYAIEK